MFILTINRKTVQENGMKNIKKILVDKTCVFTEINMQLFQTFTLSVGL